MSIGALLGLVLEHGPAPGGRPVIVAVDGRAGSGKSTLAGALWGRWMVEEVAFLERDRPWERAALIVAGAPDQPDIHDRDTEVLVAPAFGIASRAG